MTTRAFALLAAAVVGLGFSGTTAATALQPAHPVIVNADPVDWTPHVEDGRVNAVAQIGTTAYVGGSFTSVKEATGAQTRYARPYLIAVNTTTGAVVPRFAPSLNNTVEALAVGPDGKSLLVGGAFTAVNGVTMRKLVRLDLTTGGPITGFSANANALVQDLVVRDGWAYVSGRFTKIKGKARSGLARLDPATGAVDANLDVRFTDPPSSSMGVPKIAVNPSGSSLVAIGNFGKVGGLPRIQIAMLDLASVPVKVADWRTHRFPVYDPDAPSTMWCSTAFPSYMRDVDFSPDGQYFVVSTTGANRPNRLCDTVSRWESSARGNEVEPTWVNWTGGDTLTAVATTGAAVYVGGHQRWLNNPYVAQACGVCPAGPGSVPRTGIAALDPVNGLPFSWNPGRDRGYGVTAFHGTNAGLWVGSDTEILGGERHARLGLFPTAGGTIPPRNQPYTLTGDLFNMVESSGELRKRPYNATTMSAGTVVGVDDWRAARGAFALEGRLYTGWSDGTLTVRPFDGSNVGPAETVNLHGLELAPPSTFLIPGTQTPIPSLASHLANATGMFFDRGRLYYTVVGDPRLYYRFFTPESRIVGASLFVASTGDGVDWSQVRGMTMSSGQLVYATNDGQLWRAPFDGRPVGAPTRIGGPDVDGVDWASTGFFAFN